MTTRILAFGAGKDSTAILAMHLMPWQTAKAMGWDALDIMGTIGHIDHVVFSDTGAEHRETYRNVETAEAMCRAAGVRFSVIRRHDGDDITSWVTRHGMVPVMPGGPHVCSRKFKGDVMRKWAEETYGGTIEWIIGIEADEQRRAKRFQGAKGDDHRSVYPLIEMGVTREIADRVVEAVWPMTVRKSSCTFCPFMQAHEIEEMLQDDEYRRVALDVEIAFRDASAAKHQAWLDAGSPRVGKSQRAPAGMWSRDSWAEGARLFAKRDDGRQRSVAEWMEKFGV